MLSIDEHMLQAFRDELRKEAGYDALIAKAAPRLRNVGSLAGVGTLAGGVGGAGIGGVAGYRQAREQGATRGEALSSAAGGAAKGLVRGAAIGAGTGAALGSLSKSPALAGLAERPGAVGAFSRFGQRQVHGVTGMLTPEQFEKLRGGSFDARQAAHDAGAALTRARQLGAPAEEIAKHQKNLQAAGASLKAHEAVTGMKPGGMNLTSIPDVVRSMRNHPAGEVLRAAGGQQLSGANLGMAALTVGMPALTTGHALLSKDTPDAEGHAKAERVGHELGQTVGGLVGGAIPLVGSMAVGDALGYAGGTLGKGVDKLRGARKKPQAIGPGMTPNTLEPAEMGQHTPTERNMSPAAAGQQPDIGL